MSGLVDTKGAGPDLPAGILVRVFRHTGGVISARLSLEAFAGFFRLSSSLISTVKGT
jgi:hypothetical protein